MGRMEEIIMERARRNNRRMKALQNVIDNQKEGSVLFHMLLI